MANLFFHNLTLMFYYFLVNSISSSLISTSVLFGNWFGGIVPTFMSLGRYPFQSWQNNIIACGVVRLMLQFPIKPGLVV